MYMYMYALNMHMLLAYYTVHVQACKIHVYIKSCVHTCLYTYSVHEHTGPQYSKTTTLNAIHNQVINIVHVHVYTIRDNT